MAQKTGRVTIKLNGSPLVSQPGATLQIGGIQRDPDMSDQGQIYYREKIVPATISATLIHTSETDLIALRDFRDGTVNFECDTGRLYVVNGAFTVSVGDLKSGEVEWSGAGNPADQS